MKKGAFRALVEIGFIVFLFYANLVMGEFTHSGAARNHSLMWAISDAITPMNLVIGIIAGLIGYVLFETLRRRL